MSTQRNNEAFDFDAWYAESVQATIPFKLLGRDWELPGDCDAAIILTLNRLERWIKSTGWDENGLPTLPFPDGLDATDLDKMSFEGMCRSLVGDELVDEWLKAGIKQQMLKAVSKRLYGIYSGQDPDEAMGLGKAAPTVKQPQDRKPKKASSTG